MAKSTGDNQPRIVYALASKGDDNYARMAEVSVYCTRRIHPELKVTLVCDEVTAAALPGKADRLTDNVDDVVVVQTGMPTAMERSRFVKTTLRQNVQGDFIFLDVDAIPVRSFKQMLNGVSTFGAVPNTGPSDGQWMSLRSAMRVYLNRPIIASPNAWDFFTKMGWPQPPSHYFNSGVTAWRDTPDAHRLCETWHKRWLDSRAAGECHDQFALARAIDETGVTVNVLHRRYNGQIGTVPWYANGAAILHFFTHDVAQPNETSMLAYILDRYQQTGELDASIVDELLRTKYAWRIPSVKLAIASGRYVDAAKVAASRVFSRKA